MKPVEISITISTFRRPVGLKRLLDRLTNLDASSPPFEVVVVDNDAGETARAVVDGQQPAAFGLRYCAEPVQSISRARNRGVLEASGRFVAFIDDDEWPDPLWLVKLWSVAQETMADAVIGPVVSVLPESTPRWMNVGRFFQRPTLETGRGLAWYQTTTANALIRRSVLVGLPTLFDEAFALTGGEDSELFHRLLAGGFKVVGSSEGVVYEDVSASRVSAGSLLKRSFRNGMTSARLARRPRAVRRLSAHMAATLGWLPRDRVQAFRRMLWSASALGEIAAAAGFRYEPYRAPARASRGGERVV